MEEKIKEPIKEPTEEPLPMETEEEEPKEEPLKELIKEVRHCNQIVRTSIFNPFPVYMYGSPVDQAYSWEIVI